MIIRSCWIAWNPLYLLACHQDRSSTHMLATLPGRCFCPCPSLLSLEATKLMICLATALMLYIAAPFPPYAYSSSVVSTLSTVPQIYHHLGNKVSRIPRMSTAVRDYRKVGLEKAWSLTIEFAGSIVWSINNIPILGVMILLNDRCLMFRTNWKSE